MTKVIWSRKTQVRESVDEVNSVADDKPPVIVDFMGYCGYLRTTADVALQIRKQFISDGVSESVVDSLACTLVDNVGTYWARAIALEN